MWPTPDDTERWIGSTIYFEDFERGDNLTLSSNSSNEMWEDYLNRVPTQPLNQYDAMVLWLKMFNTVLISEENDPFDLVQIAGTIGKRSILHDGVLHANTPRRGGKDNVG